MDNMKNIEEAAAFDLGLPKWPQMLVTGERISVEQAKEIIFATDSFLTSSSEYSGGNDRAWIQRFHERCGYAQFKDQDWGLRDELRRRAEFLTTEYVDNNWASCAFIHGPHGWCHPDGKIQYVDNVGKWPSISAVASDWKKIAARWPFLDLWVTLMNGEGCEDGSVPVVTFRVTGGALTYFEGSDEPHRRAPTRNLDDGISHVLLYAMGRSYSHERGLPEEWLDEFATKIRPLVDAVVADRNIP